MLSLYYLRNGNQFKYIYQSGYLEVDEMDEHIEIYGGHMDEIINLFALIISLSNSSSGDIFADLLSFQGLQITRCKLTCSYGLNFIAKTLLSLHIIFGSLQIAVHRSLEPLPIDYQMKSQCSLVSFVNPFLAWYVDGRKWNQ